MDGANRTVAQRPSARDFGIVLAMPLASSENTSEQSPFPECAAHTVSGFSTGRIGAPSGEQAAAESPSTGSPSTDDAQLFRALIEGATDFAIFKLDASGQVAAWNAGAERLLGYRADEVLGRHFALFFTDEDRAAGLPERELAEARTQGRSDDENWLVRKGGARFWASGQSTALRDEGGSLLGFAKICRDCSDRRRADEAARRQAALLEQAYDAVIVHSPDNTVLLWNRAAEELYGWSRDEAVGRPAYELLQTRFPTTLAEVRAALEATGRWEGELTHTRRDGGKITVVSRWGLQRDECGRPSAVLEINRDVTEQKRTERALRLLADASEQLASTRDYEATLQTVARLVVRDLADYCLIDVLGEDDRLHRLAAAHTDPAKEALLGTSRSYPPDLRAGTSPLVIALAAGRSELVVDVTPDWVERATHDPEHRRLVEALGPRSVMLVPLVARDRTLGLLSIVAAESGRRYAPQDLRLAEDLARRCAAAIDNAHLFLQAREALRVRDDVLASVSHDLKSPLTSISGIAQLLQRQIDAAGEERDGPVASGLGRIVATAARMSALIDELADTARLELGQDVPLQRELTDLVELVELTIAEHQRVGEGHRIALERRADRLVGLWDPARLRRVLDNLLGNAVKYSPKGGPIRVTLDRTEDDGGSSAILAVADRGVGIPPEDRPHIFERGRRGSNVGRIAGAGIGLAGACQIVRQHGGRIDVESVVGAGSTFTVRLPLARE